MRTGERERFVVFVGVRNNGTGWLFSLSPLLALSMSCARCPTPFAQQHLKLLGPPNSGRSVAEWAPSLKRATDACWPAQAFPANKKENRGSPALCVSGNFQGKQRVFGAPFWKLASFPESESWSGAKSEAKLRKSARYPGGRRVFSRYTRGFPGIPAKYPVFCRFG